MMRWPNRERDRQAAGAGASRGFTLMELLVAAGLLALMGVVLGTSISAVMGAIRDNREMQDRYHAARVALGRMQRELSMAYLSKHQGENRTTKTVFLGKSDRVTFTYIGHRKIMADADESDEGVVEYYLERRGSGLPALVRREKVIIDDVPEKDGRRQVLAEDVRKLRFEYWNMDKESWESDWKVEIDNAVEEARRKEAAAVAAAGMTGSIAVGEAIAEKAGRKPRHGPDDQYLPVRVRISLTLATDDDDQDLMFETQSRIRLLRPLEFSQAKVPDIFKDPLNPYVPSAGNFGGAMLQNVQQTLLQQGGGANPLFGAQPPAGGER